MILEAVKKTAAATRKLTDSEQASIGELARSLDQNEITVLRQQILGATNSADQRNAALYLLTQAGSNSLEALAIIAASPIFEGASEGASRGEPPENSRRRKFETSLRVTALLALDSFAGSQGDLISQYMHQVLEKQSEPTLQFLAQVSSTGIASGRPGKLERLVLTIGMHGDN